MKRCLLSSWPWTAVSFAVLAACSALPAAFTLKIEGIQAADLPVVAARESLEERTATPVATGRVANGQLQLSVEAEPGFFNVRVGEAAPVSFVAGAGQTLRVSVDRSSNSTQVTGGRDQELYVEYERFRAESLARKVTPVRVAIAGHQAAGHEAEVARLTDAEVVAYRDHRRELNDFTLTKLRGSPALYAASLRWDGDYRLGDLAAAVNEFARENPGAAEIARLMTERIARFRATAIGALAPGVAGSSPDGAKIALQDLRGRYVLVDFWASWCSPCRIENRNYVELYQRYHGAGFEILAVSVDENATAWKAAIAKDNATWRHVSDLKGWQSPLANAYNITALPGSFLLDREGRIVAKDLRGKQLAAQLERLLGSAKNP